MRAGTSPGKIKAARILAVAADVAQWLLTPAITVPTVGLAVDDALDFVVAGVMTWLLGWHWAFLPTVLAEAVPLVNLIPSWTAAVVFVTRDAPPPTSGISPPAPGTPGNPEVLPPRAGEP